MKNIFKKGDFKIFEKEVHHLDIANFESGTVHEVYSTFSLARDAEWCGRLFVLDMKEENEEGIGTQIAIQHISPAFVHDKIKIISTFDTITEKGEIITNFEAYSYNRLIASGIQGQKILEKSKLKAIFAKLKDRS